MDQSPQPVFEAEIGARRATMAELLQDSDVVSVHVPLSAETKGLLNAMANAAARNVRLCWRATRRSHRFLVDLMALHP